MTEATVVAEMAEAREAVAMVEATAVVAMAAQRSSVVLAIGGDLRLAIGGAAGTQLSLSW